MRRFHTPVGLVLVLVMLIQGMAVSASPLDMSLPDTDPVTVADMPCHDEMATEADDGACCDTDCPNMVRCLLGNMAVIALFSIDATPVIAEAPATAAKVPVSGTLSSLLRPPISLYS